ncbi:LacI family DNA-binding transcriptional regulator, partial [Xanthomonas vesicatoria]
MHARFSLSGVRRLTRPKTSATPEAGDARLARRGAVTLRDIASAIGVSRATVSLVLRGSPLVHAS